MKTLVIVVTPILGRDDRVGGLGGKAVRVSHEHVAGWRTGRRELRVMTELRCSTAAARP